MIADQICIAGSVFIVILLDSGCSIKAKELNLVCYLFIDGVEEE